MELPSLDAEELETLMNHWIDRERKLSQEEKDYALTISPEINQ